MRNLLLICGTIAAAATLSASAQAVSYQFDLTGSRTASFVLDDTPDSFTGLQTNYTNVSGTFGGVAGTANLINFGAQSFIASLNITGTNLGFTQFAGPVLFTGPTSAPVFKLGTFTLPSIVSGTSFLTISAVPGAGAVPEPATWALMIGGFGLTGFAMRRRRFAAAMG